MLLYNSSSPLPFFLAVCSSYVKNCKYAPYKRLLVVTCVGAWVVTEWSVSRLGNSHVTTRSKFTNFRQLLVVTCELLRQETDHSVTTHTPTQVTTAAVDLVF